MTFANYGVILPTDSTVVRRMFYTYSDSGPMTIL